MSLSRVFVTKITLCSLTCLWISGQANAQIATDNTLPNPTTVETLDNRNFTITDGTPQGNNLFHSFSTFSIPKGGSAEFIHAPNIDTIFSRVTGGTISQIDGILSTQGMASFFLINPNGIIFGPNAILNVGGSFIASTAESILFADGTQFSTNLAPINPLLTVSVPVGLQFGIQVQPIRVDRSSLVVSGGNTLGLLGGDIEIEGPPRVLIGIGSLSTSEEGGGSVTLGSVGNNSTVQLQEIGKIWNFNFDNVANFQDIHLSNNTIISLVNTDVQLTGRQITLSNGSQVGTNTVNELPAGQITVNASESVEVVGFGVVNESDILRSNINTITITGTGQGGNITINTKTLWVREGGAISTQSGFPFEPIGGGRAGDITINATESVEITDFSPETGASTLTVETNTGENAGNLTINTARLMIEDGSQISARTTGEGEGGMIDINAGESIEISGVGLDFTTENTQSLVPSRIIATSEGTGDAGSINLQTAQLNLSNQGQITASSFNSGDGGNINITAQNLSLDSQARIIATSEGIGNAGNLTLNIGALTLQNQSAISVNSSGLGDAGNLNISADTIFLDQQSQLSAASNSGEGGNINLVASDFILLRRNSSISTQAGTEGGGGNGGNITLTTPFLATVATENNDIIANAFTGDGGNINITAVAIFGFEPTDILTPLSDIVASSEFGTSGVIAINRLELDPRSALNRLPTRVTDPENLVVQQCGMGGEFTRGEFVITQRGGLPLDPLVAIETNQGLADLSIPASEMRQFPDQTFFEPLNLSPQSSPLVEANGWQQNERGQIILTHRSETDGNVSPFNQPRCQ